MSALENNQVWSKISKENLSSKYEKCRNITEEIYKRINITFEIKKLESEAQSDLSDQSDLLDSNELSNETDLFACDKSTSIPSSEPEQAAVAENTEKYININNNEELKKKSVVYKRPKKKFRKRVKKRQSKPQSESDGSSDEALPLSRVVELDTAAASPDHAGVPNILILTKDVKPKILSDKKDAKKNSDPQRKDSKSKEQETEPTDARKVGNTEDNEGGKLPEGNTEDKSKSEPKSCTICSLTCKGERGLKRHLALSHIVGPEGNPRPEVKPA